MGTLKPTAEFFNMILYNSDLFVIQEGKISDGVIVDYDKFIIQKINEFPVTFRPKSGSDDRSLSISLDGTQGIRHVKAKLCEAMEVPSSANVNIYECISSMGATATPLKKRSFRR